MQQTSTNPRVTRLLLALTAVLMVLTLVYLDRFRLANPFTWIWLTLYFVIPLNAAYHLWRYRRWKPPGSSRSLPPGRLSCWAWPRSIEALASGYVGFWMPAEQSRSVELEGEGAFP
jgi:hypothetical protein